MKSARLFHSFFLNSIFCGLDGLAGKFILKTLSSFLAANTNSLKVHLLQLFLHLYQCMVNPIFFPGRENKRFSKTEKLWKKDILVLHSKPLSGINFEVSNPSHTFHFGMTKFYTALWIGKKFSVYNICYREEKKNISLSVILTNWKIQMWTLKYNLLSMSLPRLPSFLL